ncbi:N-acyl-D-amino-acid deacylase family protein [Nigerium massiliense]|uniref:N-acyl-D-amino-acid deacylase family protein n=1 Tax=Nigerium massiliense TaxID=1522317 RepID=UPI00058BF652|nr:D-aminoacylase [Nigerium massiliense]
MDFAINDVELIDGTGAPRRRAHVCIRDGRIAQIAEEPLEGTDVVDGHGLVLAPGFIDLHSHADFAMQATPDASTQLAQGVTTLITGNCGHSPFPVKDVAALRDASSFLRPQMDWSWTDLSGYADRMDALPPGVNLGLQVGHGALRIAAMGHDRRPPNDDELATMCRLLAEAADQGAVGFSTGLIYAPGSYARPDEVHALASVAASKGLLYSTHMRDERSHVREAVDEAIETARRSGVRLEISHIKAMGPGNHGLVPDILERIDAARAEGLDVAADVYPYTASSTTLTSRLPDWAMEGGAQALLRRLDDGATRTRVRAELQASFGPNVDPDGIVLVNMPQGRFSEYLGRSLTDIAAATHSTPADVTLDVLADHQATVAIVNHAMAESDLEAALAHPYVSVASDGWVLSVEGDGVPHPRSFGTFARVLARYVRERGLLSLEEGVRRMTGLPASRLKWDDRGVVATGAIADLVLFDPEHIADLSTFAEPWALATGVERVWLSGRPAWKAGEALTPRQGHIVRAPSDH